MTECRLFEENGRRPFMTKWFDRLDDGEKRHMQSLAALAHFDFNNPDAHSYEHALITAIAAAYMPSCIARAVLLVGSVLSMSAAAGEPEQRRNGATAATAGPAAASLSPPRGQGGGTAGREREQDLRVLCPHLRTQASPLQIHQHGPVVLILLHLTVYK